MAEYTALNYLLQDVFASETPAEARHNSRAADDCILELAEKIKARRAKPAVTETPTRPRLEESNDDLVLTLIRDGKELTRTFPIKGFGIYKTNEVTQMALEGIKVNPDKDGYTWYMSRQYLAPGREIEKTNETLQPSEGRILSRLLAEIWEQRHLKAEAKARLKDQAFAAAAVKSAFYPPAVKQDEALPTPVLLNECAPSVKPAAKSEPKIGLRRTDYDGLVYEPGGTALMRGPAPLLRSPCVLNYQDEA